tara:strand:+ start:52 stop:237 length:186 start_codon:yes stop_codon:yes gene_type:complete
MRNMPVVLIMRLALIASLVVNRVQFILVLVPTFSEFLLKLSEDFVMTKTRIITEDKEKGKR